MLLDAHLFLVGWLNWSGASPMSRARVIPPSRREQVASASTGRWLLPLPQHSQSDDKLIISNFESAMVNLTLPEGSTEQ